VAPGSVDVVAVRVRTNLVVPHVLFRIDLFLLQYSEKPPRSTTGRLS
jgi:hypothetical protein